MFGKLVLCAVLCIAFNQVCLARPEQPRESEVASFESQDVFDDARISSCRSNLRQVVLHIAYIGYDFGVLGMEALAALSDGVNCFLNADSNFPKCLHYFAVDTIYGVRDAITDSTKNIGYVVQSIGDSFRTCWPTRTPNGREVFPSKN